MKRLLVTLFRYRAKFARPVTGRRHAQGGRAASRHGVSLLEVTFSIGVVMIGLVGIASLIPVGGALARKGAIADAAAQTGANAAREFTACGMANPQNWRWYNTSTSQFVPVVIVDGITPMPGQSFCLDPVFVSAVGPSASTYAAEMAARAQFPLNYAYDSTLLAMPRITLRSNFTPNFVLNANAAQRLFVADDDLIFDMPSDRTLGPVQNFSFQNSAPANPLRRNSEGRISWMATIVPKLDRLASNAGTLTPTYEYTLSVVVFSQRPLDRELIDTSSGSLISEDQVSERVVSVQKFYSGSPAFSGGDMRLVSRPSRGTSGEDDLALQNGDWLMFSGVKTTLAGSMQVHKWYRVVHAGDEPQPNGSVWTRDVTVMGPDWDIANIPMTQVTIVRGVTQVLERTVQLETSSMWKN